MSRKRECYTCNDRLEGPAIWRPIWCEYGQKYEQQRVCPHCAEVIPETPDETPQEPKPMPCPPAITAWIAQDPAKRLYRSDGLIIWNRGTDHGAQVFIANLTPEELATPEALHAALLARMIATSESMAIRYRQEAEDYLARAARHDAIVAELRAEQPPIPATCNS